MINIIKTSMKLLSSLLLGLVLAPGLFAQTTAFTYQGRLNQSGAPTANGIYDLQFSLFNVASGGAAVAGPLSSTMGVTGGLFTVSLDFTGTPFTGQNLWLQIAVRTNGIGTYSNLSPRQPITSSPYAIRALDAGTAATATSVAANGVNAAAIQNGAIALGKLAAGVLQPSNFPPNSVTSLQLADNIALGGSNVVGELDVFRTAAGSPAISLLGASSQISTYGSDGLEQIRLWGVTWGELLLNNSLPNNANAVFLSANNANGGILSLNNTNGVGKAVLSGANSGASLSLYDAVGTLSLHMTADDGSISFGSQVRQMLNLWSTQYGIGVQAATLYQRTDGNFAWFKGGSHSDSTFDPGTGGTNLMLLDYAGHLFANAGITVDNANANVGDYYPGIVFGPGSGESIASKRDPGVNQYGLDFYTGFLKRMSLLNDGGDQVGTLHLGGFGANGDPKLVRFGDGDYVHVGENGADDTLELKGTRIYMTANNESSLRVGIGTSNPAEKLHVNGNFIRVEGAGGEQAYLGGDGAGNDVQVGSFNPAVTAVALWNVPNGDYMHLYVKAITITGGADLAEPFEMSHQEIPQGAVVVIDEENPGQLKMSAEAYDTHVAGIVSGAGGINPGIQLKQTGALEAGKNVALTGRVYALADATSAPIKPGDLLTTSSTPGHCMKASDRDRAQGAILGKAMTGLKEGKGQILVLVTLQ